MSIFWGRVAGLAVVATTTVPIAFASTANAVGDAPAALETRGSRAVVTDWLTASVDAIEAAIAQTVRSIKGSEGVVVGDGARVRAEPVVGAERDTLRRGSRVVVLCERRVPGGHYWGMIVPDPPVAPELVGGFGWVRGDLYDVPGRAAAGPRSC